MIKFIEQGQMKQTTIFDFFPKRRNKEDYIEKIKNNVLHNPSKNLESVKKENSNIISNVQQSLFDIIDRKKRFEKYLTILGDEWYFQEDGLGFTNKDNIMVFSTYIDFKKKFFNLYNFEDFKQINNLRQHISNLMEDKNKYILVDDIEYSSYYLFKAIKILGNECKIYQHSKLKLLFIQNDKYAALICPKF